MEVFHNYFGLKQYKDVLIRLEYRPYFKPSMHIDILVIVNDRWIPIELKYNIKGCTKKIESEVFVLNNHGAKDIICYCFSRFCNV